MSKLQKKKPYTDKKKRNDESDGDSSGSVASVSKPVVAVSAKKPKLEKGAAGANIGSSNIFGRAAEFVREVKVELKKVTWPTRKQTTGTTIVVILFVFVVAAFLGLFDYGLSSLFRLSLHRLREIACL